MSESKAYGYAVARIRAMEPLLLDSGVYQRMLDADGAEGAIKVLSETAYGKTLTESAGGRYDAALEAELLSTFEDFASFVPDKGLIDIFRIPYDFHNIKVVLKSIFNSRSGGKKRWDLLSPLGTIPTEKLTVNIESEEYVYLPYGLSTLIPEIMAMWEQSHDIVEIERRLDKAMFGVMLKIAKDAGHDGVVDWIKARIDGENIRNLLRLKRFGFDAADAEAFMVPGGKVKVMDLIPLLNEPFENWGRMISLTGIGEAVSSVQEDGGVDKLLADLERSMDDHCQAIIAKARYSASAPENVIAYLWGKEQEMKNIRTIMVSKSTDQSADETRRLMRHGY